MRRELFGHPGGEGLALQPSERPRPPRAHGYWYPDGGAEPTDASDGGPYVPNEGLGRSHPRRPVRWRATCRRSRAGRTAVAAGSGAAVTPRR